MKTALISLQALLCAAEPDDPQDAVVATMYKSDRALFDQTAREWTLAHADMSGAGAEAGAAPVAPRPPPVRPTFLLLFP